jgi:chitinase
MTTITPPPVQPVRRLSVLRLFIAIIVTAALVVAGFVGWQIYSASASVGKSGAWFASYVDVTAAPQYAFEDPTTSAGKQVVLSFIVAGSDSSGCTPSWGGAYSLDEASASLDLDRRIARLQQQGGDIAISFGGLKNQELAVTCDSVSKLAAAYESVIDRYSISTIDLDIEGAALTNSAANARRAQALEIVQKHLRSEGKSLAIWLTLPVAPTGLQVGGQDVVRATLAGKVDIAGVNAMTMDYGTLSDGQTMLTASESALTQTERQLGILYKQAGITLNDRTLWSKIGATPMIGQNDDQGEIFTIADARALNSFAASKGVGRMSMWSLNRDVSCGSNYVTLTVVSDSCSGVAQGGASFATILAKNFGGSTDFASKTVTKSEPVSSKSLKDNPTTSPYPIWSSTASYLEGTKIVWHHNVYVAKWWTQGDIPDNPVLNSWQTPWTLIGPVLKGEKPIVQPTVPSGTFPTWDGTAIYNKGDRVIFDGTPYQAKWWTQGDSPAAASSNPDSSPWVPLTVAQINLIDKELRAKR